MFEIYVYRWSKYDEKYYKSFFAHPFIRLSEVYSINIDEFNEACETADTISFNNKNLLVCVFKNDEKWVLGRGRVEKEIDIARYNISGIEIC